MVQVDVVWAYAFGASLASASARQLEKDENPFVNKYYTFVLLFLACLFAPSGIYLLWEFPHWETMQLARSHNDIPSWLVVLFAVTNITQGILGYWVSYRFAKKGKYYASHVNWMVAWIVFWFILMCGWDGSGWQRFLYDPTMNNGELWEPGKHMGLSFFLGNVWMSIMAMAVIIVPVLYTTIVKWLREGAYMDKDINPQDIPGALQLFLVSFLSMWLVALVIALVATFLVVQVGNLVGNMTLGYLLALPLYTALVYFLLFRKPMPIYKLIKTLFIQEKN